MLTPQLVHRLSKQSAFGHPLFSQTVMPLQKTCGILRKGENRSTLVQVGVHYYQERFKGKENNVLLPKSV
jgi:hypothetical protein